MADDQEASNEDEGIADYDAQDAVETTTVSEIQLTTTTAVEGFGGDEEEEDLPEVTVNLIINDGPDDITIPTDLAQAGLADVYGNRSDSATPLVDAVTHYSQAITQGVYDELNGNGTAVGGKGWFGAWTWNKILFVGLIALCIIGIILALLFIIIGKKFKKNKRTTTTGSTTTTKSVVTSNVATGGKYEPVRNV